MRHDVVRRRHSPSVSCRAVARARPSVFVGSSTEGRHIADSVQVLLDSDNTQDSVRTLSQLTNAS